MNANDLLDAVAGGDKRYLQHLLRVIVENDSEYVSRNRLIYEALYVATKCGYEVGFRIDPQETEWPVAFIQLPTGQVSWHLPQFSHPWDGHSTEEKFRRIREFRAPFK
jgi:hypothetical protein